MNLFEAFGDDLQSITTFLDDYYSRPRKEQRPMRHAVGLVRCPWVGLSADQICQILAQKGITTIIRMDRVWSGAVCSALGRMKIRRAVTSKLDAGGHHGSRHAYNSLLDLLESIQIRRQQQSDKTNSNFRFLCLNNLSRSRIFVTHPSWRVSVLGLLDRICPNLRLPKWTPERFDRELAAANAAGWGRSQLKRQNRSLLERLKSTNSLHLLKAEVQTFKGSIAPKLIPPRQLFTAKNKYPGDVLRTLKLGSATNKDEKHYLLYGLLNHTLPDDVLFLTCENEIFFKVAAYLQISSWADCVTSFPVLAETLARRSMGFNTAAILWPDAPEASTEWMRDDYVPYHKRGVVKKAA